MNARRSVSSNGISSRSGRRGRILRTVERRTDKSGDWRERCKICVRVMLVIGTLSSKDHRNISGIMDSEVSLLLDNKLETNLEYSFWRCIMSDVEGGEGSGWERR